MAAPRSLSCQACPTALSPLDAEPQRDEVPGRPGSSESVPLRRCIARPSPGRPFLRGTRGTSELAVQLQVLPRAPAPNGQPAPLYGSAFLHPNWWAIGTE